MGLGSSTNRAIGSKSCESRASVTETAAAAADVVVVDEEDVMERGRGAEVVDRKPLPLRSPISAVVVFTLLRLFNLDVSISFVSFLLPLLLLL